MCHSYHAVIYEIDRVDAATIKGKLRQFADFGIEFATSSGKVSFLAEVSSP